MDIVKRLIKYVILFILGIILLLYVLNGTEKIKINKSAKKQLTNAEKLFIIDNVLNKK